jgi:MarR family 2-MHQ and catechol resistance regulon transcriptional repressor
MLNNMDNKFTKTDALALKTYIKLMRAAESVTARIHKQLSEKGLTISQFGILEALYHLGPMSQRDVGNKILKSSGNITMVIDNLEKRKLVKRITNKTDRRSFTIHLTEAGHGFIRNFFPSHAARIVKEMSILKPSEQQELGRLCKKLGLRKEEC